MEVLSPELVLVSSDEDRRRAIEQLPPLPWELVLPPAPRSPPPYPRIVIDHVPDDVPPERTRRRLPWRLSLAAAALAAVGAVGYLSETRWHEARPTLAALPTRSQAAPELPPPTLGVTTQQPAAPTTTTRALPPTTTAPPTPRVTTTRAETVPPPATTVAARTVAEAKKPAPKSPPPAGFVPARTWAWVPSKGAASYDVAFYLDGRVVLRAHPTEARLVMPPSFRYHAGRYRWTVQAKPSGATVVDSAFVLTADAAAAANGS